MVVVWRAPGGVLVLWIFQHKRKSMACWWWWFGVVVVWIFQHKKVDGLLVVGIWRAGGVDFPTQTQVDGLLVVAVVVWRGGGVEFPTQNASRWVVVGDGLTC